MHSILILARPACAVSLIGAAQGHVNVKHFGCNKRCLALRYEVANAAYNLFRKPDFGQPSSLLLRKWQRHRKGVVKESCRKSPKQE